MKNIKASELKTGMKYWDGSLITVLSETKCFITCFLSDGEGMEGKGIGFKWNKNSIINLAE